MLVWHYRVHHAAVGLLLIGHLDGIAGQRNRHLVMDLGFNVGSDSQTYLAHGYDVVAVEASPLLVRAAIASDRFSQYISVGQLTLINAGIAETSGSNMTFWANPTTKTGRWSVSETGKLGKPSSSCFLGDDGERSDVNRCKAYTVPVMTCQDLLDTAGIPLYLKVDIEGFEASCLLSLQRQTDLCNLPFYVSFQSMKPKLPSKVKTKADLEAGLVLAHLKRLGYRYFKQTVLQSPFNKRDDVTWPGMGSGPFGEWALDNETGVLWTDMSNKEEFRKDGPLSHEWVDIHARLPGLPTPCVSREVTHDVGQEL